MGTPGKIVLLDSGKQGLLVSGKRALKNSTGDCDSCCAAPYKLVPCTEPGSSCNYCGIFTPKYWTLDFSNITYRTDCVNVAGDEHVWKVTHLELDGHHVAIPQGSGCAYYGPSEDRGEIGNISFKKYHSGADCSSDYGMICEQTEEDAFGIWFEMSIDSPTTFHIAAYSSYRAGACDSQGIGVAYGVKTAGSCSETLTATFDASGTIITGGTITVRPGDIYGSGHCPGGNEILASSDLSAYVGKTVTLLSFTIRGGLIVNYDFADCFLVLANTSGSWQIKDVIIDEVFDDCNKCCYESWYTLYPCGVGDPIYTRSAGVAAYADDAGMGPAIKLSGYSGCYTVTSEYSHHAATDVTVTAVYLGCGDPECE